MKKIVLCTILALAAANGLSTDLARYVDPFIGTGGHGHTFPGAAVPFGFVQLSPDTRTANWDGSSGYHYSDDIIYGFSHSHLSGTGIQDYCDILFAPYLSDDYFRKARPDDTKKGFSSKFLHANEIAEPGYYSVKLDDEAILAEMTVTKRVGFHRYTFPKETKEARIALDLKWRDYALDSLLRIVGDRKVEGFRRSRSWAKDQIVYFAAEFSKSIRHSEIVEIQESNLVLVPGGNRSAVRSGHGNAPLANFLFDVSDGEPLLLKVAISPVSIGGARKNLEAELAHWDFDRVRRDARKAWNEELSKIEVSGGTAAEMTNFYTALYHTMIVPNIYQDVDGKYRGLDGRVHDASGRSENYTVFSLWDTFRAAHPLYTIIDQKRTADFINTFIRHYEQGGKLPVWELAGNETDTMIGYHAVPVIADAMAKGIKGFDYEKAFKAAKHSSDLNIEGLGAYRRRGYVSMEDEQESVSRTLEYAYDDYCMAVMAKILGRRKDFDLHIRRARSYQNLFDRKTGFMRPKKNGGWVSPFAPNEVTFHFTEGNSWQYTFFVPHDIGGLIGLYGGKERFAAKLDGLFTADKNLTGRKQPDITGLIGQYAHGNEPSHHIAYLYNYADQPWKTQYYVRKIMDGFYRPKPDGLIGNEDCGQMSAWYVLSALGIYQVNPSVPVYTIGAPIFRQARIRLENGRTFSIESSGRGQYVASVKLNGRPLSRAFIGHDQIMNGGTLKFVMARRPVTGLFDKSVVPALPDAFTPVPTINAKRVFEKQTNVSISAPEKGLTIIYTTDGTKPNAGASSIYSTPFKVKQSAVIKAVALNVKGVRSQVAVSKLNKLPNDWDVTLLSVYSRQYTGGGPKGLIDGLRGTVNFASGEWQGFQGKDLEAVIDLKRTTEIRSLGGGFLQAAGSWIWMPKKIEFEVSSDGRTFTKVAEIRPEFAIREMKRTTMDYFKEIKPVRARFVRVKAKNLGKIPAWHPGAGFDAYIFVDEIFIS